MSYTGEVNPHYLGHVVDVSDSHDVEVSEDIVAGNGVKLLAKGARISAEVKDRLLQHKLRKPLEDCVRVTGGVTAQKLAETGRALLERHALLRELTGGDDRAATVLGRLQLPPALQSLLTVYCEHRPDKLPHSVGAGMLAYALARRLMPSGSAIDHERILLAGLLHDVGELYIDPALLEKGRPLEPSQWKHIVTHPIVAHRLLKDMDGAGPVVAEAVLQHHERLDGFGYPFRSRGIKVSTAGQILSVSELLVGLLEAAAQPLVSAVVAMKLIPGEFSRGTLDAVVTASQAATMMEAPASPAADPDPLTRRVERMSSTLRRFQAARPFLDQEVTRAGPALKPLLEHAVERLIRLQLAFSSTGLDIGEAQAVVDHLGESGPGVHAEASLVLRELEWRLKELERETLIRAEPLDAKEAPVIQRVIGLMKPAG